MEYIHRLKECGVYLQINFDTLARRDGFFNKNPWRKLVVQGMVDFIGSDCHGMDFRPMQILQGSQWMEKSVDPQLRRRMLDTNIQKILMNK